ncbi:heterokaryon incompatibility protein-domain-containing protein [Xylariales sp. PMI_506]|nr:heterokaryon incompatibility protein-domain-containing protein [Xylariales sp. PMI_506]
MSIRWNEIYELLLSQERFTWIGKEIASVGDHYRFVSPHTRCPLCRQLRASWIKPFLEKKLPNTLKKDCGDRIRIFRNLRHLAHVDTEHQAARDVLRANNAPYHIAVVPSIPGWRKELTAHIAKQGMVIVLHNEEPESPIFVPQKVPNKFDPAVVHQWLRVCGNHKKLCCPKPPIVKGMKVIDCESRDGVIQEYKAGDKYVALSYVWGKQNTRRETPDSTATSAVKQISQKGNAPKAIGESSKMPLGISHNNSANMTLPKPKPNEKALPSRHMTIPVKKIWHSTQPGASNNSHVVSKLPREVPLTIRDAIYVTKTLGYRYLWVDQYCIDQKNEKEKKEQFSRMGNIYAGSELTIFALGSDSAYGLPGVSARHRISPRQVTTIGDYTFVSTLRDPHQCIKESPWSTRGWTYQEGLFSTRRLFFTDYQMYFECNGMNAVESFRSNLKILHTLNGQRFRAYHRAGKFVCGNSNRYSHLNVRQNQANHRKVDIIRRCQYQIRQYTKRELTDRNDILNAFAGIADFYARTTARIISLAGLPVPFPIAFLPNVEREGRDHLVYALAWTHRVNNFTGLKPIRTASQKRRDRPADPWTPYDNPDPQRRPGFPSWSWAGWFGEIAQRDDLPYCYTSYLQEGSVTIQCRDSEKVEEYSRLQSSARYKTCHIRKLLAADMINFSAHVVDPQRLAHWERDKHMRLNLSVGLCTWTELHRKLVAGTLECVVLGTYGDARADVFAAIQRADAKRPKAKKRRIDMFERREPEAIICLIVSTLNQVSERVGLLRIEMERREEEQRSVEWWVSGPMKSFTLM